MGVGTLFLFSMNKKYLSKRRWNYRKKKEAEYLILSTFTEKILTKKKGTSKTVSQWHPGINLLTFKQLRGDYPSKETILELLQPLGTLEHNDFAFDKKRKYFSFNLDWSICYYYLDFLQYLRHPPLPIS